jgi:polysaccharide deacetylase 2 family uncharacterized protein YibQ
MSKRKHNKAIRLALLTLTLLALLVGAYSLASLIFGQESRISALAKEVDSSFSQTLSAAGVVPSEMNKNYVVKHNGKVDWQQIEVVVALNESQSLSSLGKRLRENLTIPAVTIKEDRRNDGDSVSELRLSVYYDKLAIYQMLLRQKRLLSVPEKEEEERPRIALVVDDVGYDVERALDLFQLHRPLTISIFPVLPHSRHIAEIAHQMGYEIMIHLPMETDANLRHNPGYLMPEMGQNEFCSVLEKDLDSVPYVVGVNNHQGSKMTRDSVAMARLMQYLAKRNVFFIDSRTASDSVAYQVAKRFGLRAAENDMFLDNEKDVDYIKGRIELLMKEAERKGKAIGICHVHPASIQALQEMFPVIDERKIKLVYASELVN